MKSIIAVIFLVLAFSQCHGQSWYTQYTGTINLKVSIGIQADSSVVNSNQDEVMPAVSTGDAVIDVLYKIYSTKRYTYGLVYITESHSFLVYRKAEPHLEFVIDRKKAIVYDLTSKKRFSYRDADVIENTLAIPDSLRFERKIVSQKNNLDTATIVFNKSWPAHLQCKLLLKENPCGVEVIRSPRESLILAHKSRKLISPISKKLKLAKKTCTAEGPPMNLLFGY